MPAACHSGYLARQMLRKYSYPTCTFVILTKRRLAVSLQLGRSGLRVPSLPKGTAKRSLTIERGSISPGEAVHLQIDHQQAPQAATCIEHGAQAPC